MSPHVPGRARRVGEARVGPQPLLRRWRDTAEEDVKSPGAYVHRRADRDAREVVVQAPPLLQREMKIQILRIHKQLKFEGFRRISKDLKGFYSISTASFVVWIDFSAHNYLETLQDLRLGFPKRPYF